ncbi:MAG TPA: SUMF1/EgtB/PvdO family nonheme iron enzyme, partial [Blastocatellia bacterium]|nr:SUMF1/EgtB/PvdO family nonheme iron enzyme [Blastocatellia bacterium]
RTDGPFESGTFEGRTFEGRTFEGGNFEAAPASLNTSPQGQQLTLADSLPVPAPPGMASVEKPRRGKRLGLVAAGAAIVLAVLAAILYFALDRAPRGLTLVLRGAPPGSEVFVNNERRGVTGADGTFKIEGEGPGELALRVSQTGFADFTTTVGGNAGEEKTVESNLLPFNVDYTGRMILIPAGEFIMGDDNHEPNETPAHKVTLPDFYIDKFEVTNGQYRRFCDQTRRPYPSNAWDPAYFAGSPESPVLGVSWDDATAYARWAGKRLPREDEWEKAASWDQAASTKRMWPWGNSPGQGNAHINRNPRTPQFSPVGTYPRDASPYGVMDMGGNAAEWVDSYYLPYEGNRRPDPQYGNKNFRVVRGGFSTGNDSDARTTSRLTHPWQPKEDEKSRWLVGFRCAVSADDPGLQQSLRATGK